jgi:hypothetical protein
MVFVFESNKPQDKLKELEVKAFRFRLVVGAKVTKEDWKFSGRSAALQRNLVNHLNYAACRWIYLQSALRFR